MNESRKFDYNVRTTGQNQIVQQNSNRTRPLLKKEIKLVASNSKRREKVFKREWFNDQREQRIDWKLNLLSKILIKKLNYLPIVQDNQIALTLNSWNETKVF